MTDDILESKPVEESTNQSAPVDETNSELGADESKQTEDVIDYKEELERERARRERAEGAIVKYKTQAKKADDYEPASNDDDMVERIVERLDKRFSERELVSKEKEVSKTIASLSNSESEANLIRWHLENSIRSSGDVDSDIRRAKLLANEKAFLAEKEELSHALRTKRSAGTARMRSGRKQSSKKDLSVSEREKGLLQNFGATELYEKKYS